MSFNINTEGVRPVSAARENAETVRTVTENNDLAFLWRHAWAYADTFPRNDGDVCDAYANHFVGVHGEAFIRGSWTPDHAEAYHLWRKV